MYEDRDYFYGRAEAELEAARKASSPEAVRAHYHLAAHYLDKVYRPSSEEVREPRRGV